MLWKKVRKEEDRREDQFWMVVNIKISFSLKRSVSFKNLSISFSSSTR